METTATEHDRMAIKTRKISLLSSSDSHFHWIPQELKKSIDYGNLGVCVFVVPFKAKTSARVFTFFIMAQSDDQIKLHIPFKRRKGSEVADMEEEIDVDVQLLEMITQRSVTESEIDFVNLDQLGNTIGSNKLSKDRKVSLDDVLNQTIKHGKALTCIDTCIQLVLDTWNVKQLKLKKAEDLYALLQHKQHKMTIWEELIGYFYDKPSFICAKIIRIAKRIVLFIYKQHIPCKLS